LVTPYLVTHFSKFDFSSYILIPENDDFLKEKCRRFA
jgi:hypothetical protein